MSDFVIREWNLAPHPGDQAPLHVHHCGDEAFSVLDGLLEVQDGDRRLRLETGEFHVVTAGTAHTFATVADCTARVLVVMNPEIDELIQALHCGEVADRAALWARYHSALVD